MSDSIEDLASNLFLKFFMWQISFMIKGAILLLLFPFYLIKWIFGSEKTDN